MRIEFTFKPGGEVIISANGEDITPNEAALGVMKCLKLLSVQGRIPFSKVGAIESHKHKGTTEKITHTHTHKENNYE